VDPVAGTQETKACLVNVVRASDVVVKVDRRVPEGR
jgi:hypothetical protein